ncbi:MAG: S-methyl-5-thioribose-1-phosphate isomerase [Oscillospiraceae bacterium]|nr:S-methyl-5-thioribose-1-phosphate isomerase [Oscillospiraceae bacterium]
MDIQETDTVSFDREGDALVIIDQTKLPGEVVMLRLTDRETIYEAIRSLRVRGAPAIGAAAAVGLAVLASRRAPATLSELREGVREDSAYLASSRPTAVNLFWALSRMEKVLERGFDTVNGALEALRREADAIIAEDVETCRSIGENGLTLLHDGMGVLTHCNAGKLATIRYGTATAPMYLALERGMKLRIYADETRPLLQGARLTAYELSAAGADVTLQCDDMAASAMAEGLIDIVITGADRIAANGDSANKIGTLGLAVLAKHYGIPFYIAAPFSTIDLATPDGSGIVVEQRDGSEVTELWYARRMAPEGVKVRNPAFDVTDNSLITGIITEKGIARPDYLTSLRALAEE